MQRAEGQQEHQKGQCGLGVQCATFGEVDQGDSESGQSGGGRDQGSFGGPSHGR